ncbi:hypothetical protein C8R47DRAFT_1072014 [Mycena vitilis]|nr:hypothetical protein C8R47DRAFT_1072014 [Mycena vitilis]
MWYYQVEKGRKRSKKVDKPQVHKAMSKSQQEGVFFTFGLVNLSQAQKVKKGASYIVEGSETSKLGWTRGQTYFDTYAPALPKKAILGAAGYKAEDTYDPVWTRVHVPQQFLRLICPNAESVQESIANKANLSGAWNYWKMVIDLRPYAFQCGAAIFQKCPKSALFRLPAFMGSDVRNWMKTTFPSELALLQAKEGSPADLLLIQNTVLRKSLEDLFIICNDNAVKLKHMTDLIQRRTAVLSPAQGFSASTYHQNALMHSSPSSPLRASSSRIPATPPIFPHFDENVEETGTYLMESGIRAFVNTSPHARDVPRVPTQYLLFSVKNRSKIGQKSARWPDVFAVIEQPKYCWDVWGPTKTVDKFSSVNEIWATYVDGDAVYNDAGVQTGKKPPIQLVEKYLQTKWRTPEDQKERQAIAKHWGRYREIPEWIESQSHRRGVSPAVIVAELEAMRSVDGNIKGLNWLRMEVEKLRKEAAQAAKNGGISVSAPQSIATTPAPALASSPRTSVSPPPSSLGPAFEEDNQPRKRAAAKDPRHVRLNDRGETFEYETGFLLLTSCFLLTSRFSMGIHKLWELLKRVAEKRSLLNLATHEGFMTDKRGLRTLIVGLDISIQIDACMKMLEYGRRCEHTELGQPWEAGVSQHSG